jgi:hypothetical protein
VGFKNKSIVLKTIACAAFFSFYALAAMAQINQQQEWITNNN